MSVSEWFPLVFSAVNGVLLIVLNQRYKRYEDAKKADASVHIKEMDDRKVLTEQIMSELKEAKEERTVAYAEIQLLNQKLIAAERRNVELTIQLEQVRDELTRLKEIMVQIDPTVVSKGCKLFGTNECPFTKAKNSYVATIGGVGNETN